MEPLACTPLDQHRTCNYTQRLSYIPEGIQTIVNAKKNLICNVLLIGSILVRVKLHYLSGNCEFFGTTIC